VKTKFALSGKIPWPHVDLVWKSEFLPSVKYCSINAPGLRSFSLEQISQKSSDIGDEVITIELGPMLSIGVDEGMEMVCVGGSVVGEVMIGVEGTGFGFEIGISK
jgi:hypothetical protein